jgi:hypothetical protein
MKSDIGFATRIVDTGPSRGRSVALILSDEPTAGLDRLTAHRCKAALPFGGKYRLIDFALSNCANSRVGAVGVITQYRPRSLHAHLDYGRPWDLDRCADGLTLLHPYQAHAGIGWYKGSADAVYQNLSTTPAGRSARDSRSGLRRASRTAPACRVALSPKGVSSRARSNVLSSLQACA